MDFSNTRRRLSAALQNYTVEEIHDLGEVGHRWSQSTEAKNSWVEKLYREFCGNLNVEMFPFDCKTLIKFVKFLGLNAGYPMSTIKNVIIASLKRLNIKKTGRLINQDEEDAIKSAVRDLFHSKIPKKTLGWKITCYVF